MPEDAPKTENNSVQPAKENKLQTGDVLTMKDGSKRFVVIDALLGELFLLNEKGEVTTKTLLD